MMGVYYSFGKKYGVIVFLKTTTATTKKTDLTASVLSNWV